MGRRRKRASTRKQPSRPVEPAILPRPSGFDRVDYVVGSVVVAAAGILYLLTAARDIVLGDTPELVTAAITLGIPHPPGYPLFTMLGHLFSLLPAGAPPFRVDLLAVACGTATVALVYFTALRISGSRIASACGALVLAVTPLFWSWSLVAEVFSLNNMLAALFVYLLVVWHEGPERMGFLIAAAFVSGLALTNQQTIVLLGPAVLFLLWRNRRELLARPRALIAAAGALVIGLLPYAYLPLAASRHPKLNWGDPSSLDNLIAVVTRKHFGTGQLINAPQFQGGDPVTRILALAGSFSLVGGILLLLGMVQAYRRQRWYYWFALLAFALAGPVFVGYANINLDVPLTRFVLERFYLLSHVLLAPLMAFGVLLAAELLGRFGPALRARADLAVSAAVLLAVVGGVIAHYREIDYSKDHVTRRLAEDILATLEPDSILVVNGDEVIMPLTYLQDVEGRRPDVALMVMPFLYTDWYVPQLRSRHPNLVVPFEKYGGPTGNMKALIEANPSRPVAVIGIASEDSIKGSYWFYRRGLVAEVEPMSRDVKLDELIADNERLFTRYRPPAPGDIKEHSLERTVLTHYATPAFVVAQQCEDLHYNAEARDWYQRALKLDPSLTQVRAALDRLPRDQ
jgi:4-amino-4-deoxy-L-arabinose transferase-like glycosyltransferase